MFTAIAALVMGTSCSKFLTEDPKTFLSSDNYYTSLSQIETAANGLYPGLGTMEQGAIVADVQPLFLIEAMAGYNEHPYDNSGEAIYGAFSHTLNEDNYIMATIWKNMYVSIENCNSFIYGVEHCKADISETQKNLFLAEGYFFRAYYYYTLVRLWGPVPYKDTPTTSLAESKLPLTDEATIFHKLVDDLEKAEKLSGDGDWTDYSGRIRKGVIKSFLSEIYLAMTGYPVFDESFYVKAYEKAKEVVGSGAYSLYPDYASARANLNTLGQGEYILTNQHCLNTNESGIHNSFTYYNPVKPLISFNATTGGACIPEKSFYASYDDADLRKAEWGYHFTSCPSYDGKETVEFENPCVCKYWDESAVTTGKSAVNFPLIRYTNVLLNLAEAACAGKKTSDAAAIDAYYKVRSRALPAMGKPASISFEEIFKERYWEQCYEGHVWFDMLRTRKAFDTVNDKIVDLIGFTPASHSAAYTEKNVYFLYPVEEVRLNPNLKR